jgi:hypothetical protein
MSLQGQSVDFGIRNAMTVPAVALPLSRDHLGGSAAVGLLTDLGIKGAITVPHQTLPLSRKHTTL